MHCLKVCPWDTNPGNTRVHGLPQCFKSEIYHIPYCRTYVVILCICINNANILGSNGLKDMVQKRRVVVGWYILFVSNKCSLLLCYSVLIERLFCTPIRLHHGNQSINLWFTGITKQSLYTASDELLHHDPAGQVSCLVPFITLPARLEP